jgi:hypothetical protein
VDFKAAEHANFFPTFSQAVSADCDLLQTLDVSTLKFTDVVSGDLSYGNIWDSAVANICANV